MKWARQLDIACIPVLCLCAAPALLMVAGKWDSFATLEILLVNLSWPAVLYLRFPTRPGSFATIEPWQKTVVDFDRRAVLRAPVQRSARSPTPPT